MEKLPYDDDPSLFNRELETLHLQARLETANAIDEMGSDPHELNDGRTLIDIKWEDGDGMQCCLKVLKKTNFNTTVLDGGLKDQLKTDYFLSRETSMPDQENELYYFSSTEPFARLCDDSRMGIINESQNDDIKYFKIILKSLAERPTRKDTNDTIKELALEFMMAHLVVKSLIKRIDQRGRHAKNKITVKKVVEYIIDDNNEPILSKELAMIEKRINYERNNLKIA